MGEDIIICNSQDSLQKGLLVGYIEEKPLKQLFYLLHSEVLQMMDMSARC